MTTTYEALRTKLDALNVEATAKLSVEANLQQGSNGLWYVYKVSGVVVHKDMSGQPHEFKTYKKVSRKGSDTPMGAVAAL